jgi:PAS domain S-box-containing protein
MAEARARILTVDDAEAKRHAITRILRTAGFEVEEASSGEEALQRAKSKPDLIVLDVKLPDIDGFEVCRRLRADPELSSIPVLHLSATYTRPSDRVTGLEAGADAYMTDPVEPAELVATVNALLRVRRAEEQARTTARQWQTTFDALRDGIAVTSASGKILEANRALADLLDMSADDLRGRLLAHRYREAFGEEPPSVLDPNDTDAGHVEVNLDNRWLRLRRDPIRDERGSNIGAVHIIADITAEKRANASVRFLAEAATQLSSTLIYDEILTATARIAIPMLGDFAAIDLVGEGGALRRAAVASSRPGVEDTLQQMTVAPHGGASAVREALATGTPQHFTIGEPTLGGGAEALGIASGIALPLVAQGVTVGVLTLGVTGSRRFASGDDWLAEGFARAAGSALANALTHAAVREAERRAQEARALVDVVMENAPLGIGIFDRALRYLRVNAALAQINGVAAEGHVGHTVFEIVPDIAETMTRDIQQVLDRGVQLTRDVSGHTPAHGKELRHWLVSYYPLRAGGGPVFAVGTMVVDVTERRQVEDRQRFLAEASRILSSSLDSEAILTSIAQVIVPALADWCTVDVLEAGEIKRIAVAHVTPEKVALARELQRRWPLDPNASQGVPNVLRTGKSEWLAEIPATVLENSIADPERLATLKALGLHSYMCVPLVARGVTFGAISFVTAESGKRYTEEDLAFAEELARRASLAVENARLYTEAQAAVRAREDVLAFVSHDLKNPLTSIVMNATLLKRATPEGEAGDKLRKHSEMIVRAADRMNRLVHDLLDWASLRAGRLTVTPKDVEVAGLLQESASLLQSVAAMKEQTLTVETPADLIIAADRDRLLRVLSNLVGNALKYTPDRGTIVMRATMDGNDVVISVSDTGPGIKPDELPQVFDRYFRAKQAGAEGTGLGLAIAKGIVEAHGGRIWVESKVGRGSTFSFSIPRKVESST